jgi:hypothetical protein
VYACAIFIASSDVTCDGALGSPGISSGGLAVCFNFDIESQPARSSIRTGKARIIGG